MSGPTAEGGPLPPVDPVLLAAHERRIAEWEAEIAKRIARNRSQEAETMPNPTGGEDQHSQDNPPPKPPDPKK